MLISVSISCEASAAIALSQTMVFVTRRLFVSFVVRRPCASSVTIYSACILFFVSLSYKISC